MVCRLVIGPAHTEWSSPVFLHERRMARFVFRFDYLNKIPWRCATWILCFECTNVSTQWKMQKYFLHLIDVNITYWQVNTNKEDRANTAFVSWFGLRGFTRLCFRPNNAPATFQSVLDVILTTENGSSLCCALTTLSWHCCLFKNSNRAYGALEISTDIIVVRSSDPQT